MGHWYTKAGEPRHRIMTKQGREVNTTLAHARRMGLAPSVSSILEIVSDPGLEMWKREKKNRGKAKEAADFGRGVHRLIEHYYKKGDVNKNVWGGHAFEMMEIAVALIAAVDDYGITPIESEKSFCNVSYGYGGTIDLVGVYDNEDGSTRTALVDFKTQNVAPGADFTPRKKWGAQLSSYAVGINRPDAMLLNIVAASNDIDRPPEIFDWTGASESFFEGFVFAADLWMSILGKNYDPRVVWEREGKEDAEVDA